MRAKARKTCDPVGLRNENHFISAYIVFSKIKLHDPTDGSTGLNTAQPSTPSRVPLGPPAIDRVSAPRRPAAATDTPSSTSNWAEPKSLRMGTRAHQTASLPVHSTPPLTTPNGANAMDSALSKRPFIGMGGPGTNQPGHCGVSLWFLCSCATAGTSPAEE